MQVIISLFFTVNAGATVIRNNGQFVKGNSGNPYGSRGKALSLLSNELVILLGEKGKERWPQIVDKIIKMIEEEGNMTALRFFGDYVLGKPAETVNINNDSETNLLPQFATKEAREKASEIINRAMVEMQNITEH